MGPNAAEGGRPELVAAALRTVAEAEASAGEKAEMLMEVAAGLQRKPQAPGDIQAAIDLYRHGLDLCPSADPLLRARLSARLATALMALPGSDAAPLHAARAALEAALPVLARDGTTAETAEAEMNLGLALQSLAGLGQAGMQAAIGAYQRALRVFDRNQFPQEYAILQNNLATAFLALPFADERARLSEALAVQAFEEALEVVTLIDHPREYAMLNNNLGNALQSVSSSHVMENRLRALQAYDEALKVRNARNAPGEYANTVANKANCLLGLPDDPERPEAGNPANIRAALGLYREAEAIFRAGGELAKARAVAAAIAEVESADT